MKISMIVAADEQNGIGVNNELLCHLPADLKYFRNLTTGHAILMGRKTYDSIGKPLPNRTNIIISRNTNFMEGCHVFNSIEAGIDFAKSLNEIELFIIGGDSIYKQSLALTNAVYLTRIHHTFNADAFFPKLDETSWLLTNDEKHLADEKNKFDYSFQVFEKQNKELIEFTKHQLQIINELRNCKNLYQAISPKYNNDKVSTILIEHGNFFNFIEKLVLEKIIVSLCKIIETKHNRNNHFSLFELEDKFGYYLDKKTKDKIKNVKLKIEAIELQFTTKFKFKKNLYERLKDFRDKFITHTDRDNMSEKHEAKTFPIDELLPLIDDLTDIILETRRLSGLPIYEQILEDVDSVIDFNSFFSDLNTYFKIK